MKLYSEKMDSFDKGIATYCSRLYDDDKDLTDESVEFRGQFMLSIYWQMLWYNYSTVFTAITQQEELDIINLKYQVIYEKK